jgi:integrase/recombinase XerD
MSTLRHARDDSLALRHALGFTLHNAHTLLSQFVGFLEPHEATWITTDWAVRWAVQPQQVQPAAWARRLRVVRGFAQYHSAVDPRTEIPPPALLPSRPQRRAPSLSSDAEIAQLLAAARPLPSVTGLRACTSATVFGVLAVTGMRLSEPLALDHDDVALDDGLLTMRHTKLRTSRCLPLHPTTQQALGRYGEVRHRVYPIPYSPAFFVSEQGRRLTTWAVRATCIRLSRQIGLRGPRESQGPRLHDVRHRFAVQTLVHWYQAGVDGDRHFSELSTSLGHVKVSDTSWYLSATPE